MVSLNLRRSKERCPEHQVADLVRHCPPEIFKQIARCWIQNIATGLGIQTGHADTGDDDGCDNGCDEI